MKHQFVILGLLISLSACDSEPEVATNAVPNKAMSAAKSKLNAYLSMDKVCEILTTEQLQNMFNAPAEVEGRAASFRDTYSCAYKWPRADKAEREKNLVSSMMASMSGDGPKLTMRDRMFDHELSITIKKSQRSAESFVPRKLSEEEIDQQIKAAKKRTDERLTDEQKEVAGDAANTMVEKMLRKNNENETVSGVGDAAFWTKLGTGSLEVLDGDVRISVTPVIADSKAEDFENAKQVALALLK